MRENARTQAQGRMLEEGDMRKLIGGAVVLVLTFTLAGAGCALPSEVSYECATSTDTTAQFAVGDSVFADCVRTQ